MALQTTTELLAGSLSLSVIDEGDGEPVLLLHAGAGPTSMRSLQRAMPDSRTLLPVHPGFDGTPRPGWCRRIADLTLIYLSLIERLGLSNLTVIGNSMGGWVAAELAASHSPAVARVVIIDGVGMVPTPATGPIVNPGEVPRAHLPALVYADPARFPRPPAAEGQAAFDLNQQALSCYAGHPFMCDPSLPERLREVRVPVLVLWGAEDGIVTPAYGRSIANAIPTASFQLLDGAGHFPQIERPAETLAAIRAFQRR
jgi:pimeloyl-ACP methyl ester carboxylesterase